MKFHIQTLNGATNENFQTGNNSSPIQTHGQLRLTMCGLWEPSQWRSWWVDACRILPYFHFSSLTELQSLLLHFRLSFQFRHQFPTISFTMLAKRRTSPLYITQTKDWLMKSSPLWKHATCLYQLQTTSVEFTQWLESSLSVYIGNWSESLLEVGCQFQTANH